MKNDILSKLLAKERIKVVRKTVDTASFDIKNRILTLPAWKHISDSLELMLICHEVGHALYTTEDIVEEFCKLLGVTQKTLRQSQFSYLNVVEDVRIEQLIALKYPGVKKHFVEGYIEFVEEFKAFEGAKKLTLDSLLIDRINVHCKVSNIFTVPFSDVELEILGRVQANESKMAVASLAKEIYDYDKARIKAQKKKEKEEEPEKSETKADQDEQAGGSSAAPEMDEELEETKSEENDKETSEEAGDVAEGEEDDEEPEPETAFEEHDPVIPQKHNVSTSFMVKDDFLVPWVHFSRSNATDVSHVDHPNGCVKYLREWREKNMAAVNYLVKEFNMRAAAASMKNVHEHQTGLLNARKLATHQLDKRIFLTKEIVEEGQSHGVIVAVDYSGSMEGMINKVLRQALMVAEFCKKTQIPFSVFLYTTGDNPMLANVAEGDCSTSRMFAGGGDDFRQCYSRGFEVLSSQMPKADYERAARLLMWRNCWSPNVRINNGILSFTKMSGTPTINAMLSLYSQVDAMKKKANVDKVCVYLLTDGDADSTSHSQIYLPDGRMVDMAAPEGASYMVSGMHQIKSIYNVMKDRYGDSVHVCGIRLTHKRPGSQASYEFHKFLMRYEAEVMPDYDTDEHKSTWKSAWADGSYVCKKPVASDSWIYAFVDDVEEIKMSDIDTAGKTSKSISKEFSKKLDKANIERNLLNFIVDAIK